jgi:hypothetical protein
MVSRHCNACGNENHPRLRHPASLKVESSIWGVAIVIGLLAGTWSAITSPKEEPISRALQSLSLTTAQPADQSVADPQTTSRESQSPGMRVADSVYASVISFLKSAWWVLPIPIFFSIWRQLKHYEVCRVCGSRELVPVIAPHGEELPL